MLFSGTWAHRIAIVGRCPFAAGQYYRLTLEKPLFLNRPGLQIIERCPLLEGARFLKVSVI